MKKLLVVLSLLASTAGARAGIVNGDFELGSSGWSDTSTHIAAGQLVCTVADCGDVNGAAGPNSPDHWALFGATPADATPEDATLRQTVTFPNGDTFINFWLWIGNRAGTENDFFRFYIRDVGNNTSSLLFEATAATPGFDNYQQVAVQVPNQFRGGTFDISFEFHSEVGSEGQVFNLDDVSLTNAPEPSTLGYALCGLAGLVYARKVRRRI